MIYKNVIQCRSILRNLFERKLRAESPFQFSPMQRIGKTRIHRGGLKAQVKFNLHFQCDESEGLSVPKALPWAKLTEAFSLARLSKIALSMILLTIFCLTSACRKEHEIYIPEREQMEIIDTTDRKSTRLNSSH